VTETGGGQQPTVKNVLQALDLGSAVAEHDHLLKQHFVATSVFRKVVEDRVDVVAGDKGTGKTAIFLILSDSYTSYPELSDLEVVAAFNPAGTPIFQRLLETDTLDEDQYIAVWKVYFLSLAGNWMLNFFDGELSGDEKQLDELLRRAELRSVDETPETIFGNVINRIKKLFSRIKGVEASASATTDGIPILTGKLLFDSSEDEDQATDGAGADTVRPDDALALLQRILSNNGFKIWLVVDRLDEAFQGKPAVERPALRALLRTYLDMLAFQNMRLKLFIRRDLLARITVGGFVNLTHINARKVEITWDDDDLEDLLDRRLRSEEFIEMLDANTDTSDALFQLVFPDQVDPGTRKPKTWAWMLTRIRDANGVKPPRNLIDLALKAQEQQLKREERDPRIYEPGKGPLITSDALKKGLQALSEQRVLDTLLAEAGEDAILIEPFRNGKSEHNSETLAELLGENSTNKIEVLKTLGFLEPVGSNYKIPMLYRGGLNITQGKAFSAGPSDEEDEE
jgi:hypothetical protein